MHNPTLICHIVNRLDFGGLENGVVNLINNLPADRFRHAVVALTEVTEFANRITAANVEVHSLERVPGKNLGYLVRLSRLLRKLRPEIVHTRNLGTLECQIVAWLSRVRVRIHSEHGWDTIDPRGLNPRYVLLRRLLNPFVHHYVALSREIEQWLTADIRVGEKVSRICNGVDTQRFVPGNESVGRLVIFGSVMRVAAIKNPLLLVDAFALVHAECAGQIDTRLLLVGNGPLLDDVRNRVVEHGLEAHVDLVGSQMDVVPWLHKMDVFVMPSDREGISNTILEAMACALPVVASHTGGNPELVVDAQTGTLVPVGDPAALAAALKKFALCDNLRRSASAAGRSRAEAEFSITVMADRYAEVYSQQLEKVA